MRNLPHKCKNILQNTEKIIIKVVIPNTSVGRLHYNIMEEVADTRKLE